METNLKICLIAEIEDGKYFYLRKQNQRFYFAWENKNTFSFCLGKQ